jgi:hypothetical protein
LGTAISFAGSFFGDSSGALSSVATSGVSAGASATANGLGLGLDNIGLSFPGRASGGSTVGGQPYEVAERGKPELYESGGRTYLLNSQAGHVTPASSGNPGADGANVNIDLTVVVQSDGSTTETTSSQATGNELAQKMKTISLQAIREEMAPGGIIWNMQEGRNG